MEPFSAPLCQCAHSTPCGQISFQTASAALPSPPAHCPWKNKNRCTTEPLSIPKSVQRQTFPCSFSPDGIPAISSIVSEIEDILSDVNLSIGVSCPPAIPQASRCRHPFTTS